MSSFVPVMYVCLSADASIDSHPIANGDYYEDQKEEALRKAKDFREVRLPKFFGSVVSSFTSGSHHSG